MPQHVAIQGFKGSFHEVAARQYFGAAPALNFCATFGEVVAQVADGRADAALMAMENSLAGSILPNYLLLERNALTITGEIYLPIHQHLLALPGTTLADIEAVHSHPMALRQCGDYLSQYPGWQLVETEDTGLSAQLLAERQTPGVAVIAGAQAAEAFGLQILALAINDDPSNYTRFLVLERAAEAQPVASPDKASLYFYTSHAPGMLARVLTLVAGHGLNLSKLQSCPRPSQPWHYGFHADVEFATPTQLDALLAELPAVTEELRVLGTYQRGSMVFGQDETGENHRGRHAERSEAAHLVQ
ncbi:prephenate dehydratase [Hymenobacter cheonanensis]|uniref:prephenate dehydratase n=1 Tax=Hymenobacter sp. CA2-7 TaxID=3063993 RepID=UPI00271316E2|nr:prephenate dehydratase domain-containing protein [Hymenobacter sp. CA2-7]MDO7885781.1 prephenate dehydratase domain-containing protein [Hymenobacter sp. CA2-7]